MGTKNIWFQKVVNKNSAIIWYVETCNENMAKSIYLQNIEALHPKFEPQ